MFHLQMWEVKFKLDHPSQFLLYIPLDLVYIVFHHRLYQKNQPEENQLKVFGDGNLEIPGEKMIIKVIDMVVEDVGVEAEVVKE